MMKFLFSFSCFILLLPQFVFGGVLTEDTVWRGTVEVRDDILVPEGITLTIEAGTVITIFPAESTKIDPEFLSHYTEIIVRGRLLAAGNSTGPVSFSLEKGRGEERWAGIVVDQGAVILNSCRIQDAEVALYIIDGSLHLSASTLTGNRYGIIVQGDTARADLQDSVVAENDYGLFVFGKGEIFREKAVIEKNSKKDIHSAVAAAFPAAMKSYQVVDQKTISRVYGDEALVGQTIWQGRVVVEGIVRVPPEARLIIMPGTLIEFTKKDTNGDNIGENGLLVQGGFLAKGTPESPIIFRSAEAVKKIGDWDAINILGSDLGQNIIEYCQIENAYRALHFHFSNVVVNQTILRGNFRGAQFQESLVVIKNSRFFENKSGIQARDSELVLSGNQFLYNHTGANFFRMNLQADTNIFANNNLEGLRIREGTPVVTGNYFNNNRYGLLVADAVYGDYTANMMSGNLENGILLRDTDHIRVSNNIVQKNHINGIIVQDSRTVIQGNLIIANQERGIGLQSFSGTITQNNIVANGLYGIGLEGRDDVVAVDNWWGGSDLEKEIFDSHDDAALGTVHLLPVSSAPHDFVWPFASIVHDVIWAGIISVNELLEISEKTTLAILPGTSVSFAAEGGLHSHGSIQARGNSDQRIRFNGSEGKGIGSWSEILIEQGQQSVFVHCDFENATWGLHLHYTPVTVEFCRFLNNDGGLRFRSGPVVVTNSLFYGNRIGIRSYRGTGSIRLSVLRENEIGIFIREKGADILVRENNFINNERYSIRIGDFNTEDVDARHNWWGVVDPLQTIFDDRREPGIGRVNYDPVAEHKLGLAFE